CKTLEIIKITKAISIATKTSLIHREITIAIMAKPKVVSRVNNKYCLSLIVLKKNGFNKSLAIIVEDASNVPEAVDIIAAPNAANTIPNKPGCNVSKAI